MKFEVEAGSPTATGEQARDLQISTCRQQERLTRCALVSLQAPRATCVYVVWLAVQREEQLTMLSTKGFLKAASGGRLAMKGEEGEEEAEAELARERELAFQVRL